MSFLWYSMGWASSGAISTASLIFQIRAKTATALQVRYINGKDIDGTKVDSSSSYAGLYGEDGKHHETNLEAKYVVQAGPAKDLSFRIRQAWHRANADEGEGDQNEFRLIVDYPLSIL